MSMEAFRRSLEAHLRVKAAERDSLTHTPVVELKPPELDTRNFMAKALRDYAARKRSAVVAEPKLNGVNGHTVDGLPEINGHPSNGLSGSNTNGLHNIDEYPYQNGHSNGYGTNGITNGEVKEREPIKILYDGDGNPHDVGVLYETLSPGIFSYLSNHLPGNPEQAADLAQGTFVKVIEKIGTYHERKDVPVRAWIYTVAHNHLVDFYRALSKQPTIPIGDGYQEDEVRGDKHRVYPFTLEYKEKGYKVSLDRSAITDWMRTLTPDQHNVVTLRMIQGLNIAETAQALGKSEDAVKKLLARGLLGLRRAAITSGYTYEERS